MYTCCEFVSVYVSEWKQPKAVPADSYTFHKSVGVGVFSVSFILHLTTEFQLQFMRLHLFIDLITSSFKYAYIRIHSILPRQHCTIYTLQIT